MAAFNGQGAGPFSELLTVRPEPSLAMGAWEGGAGVEGQQQVKSIGDKILHIKGKGSYPGILIDSHQNPYYF